MRYLDKISDPADLQQFSERELTLLADEVRETILSCVSETGGHLAPSLGTVELTVALHSVLQSPKDKIVWDVGHQCYAHKLLTGRRDRFGTIRQYGGLSGFPNRAESPHDIIGTGHASTSISYGLGLVEAERIARAGRRQRGLRARRRGPHGRGRLRGPQPGRAPAHAAGRGAQRQRDVHPRQRRRPAALPQPHPPRPDAHAPARGPGARGREDPRHRPQGVPAGQGRQGVDEGVPGARHAVRGARVRVHRRGRRPRHARAAPEHPPGHRHAPAGGGARQDRSRARATSRPRPGPTPTTAPGRSTSATGRARPRRWGRPTRRRSERRWCASPNATSASSPSPRP